VYLAVLTLSLSIFTEQRGMYCEVEVEIEVEVEVGVKRRSKQREDRCGGVSSRLVFSR
jgi:hypothetical protein